MLTGIKIALAILLAIAAFYGTIFLVVSSLLNGNGIIASVVIYGGAFALFLGFAALIGAAFGL